MSKNVDQALEKLIVLEKDARAFGLDWPDHKMLYDQMISECVEVMDAIEKKEGSARIQEELGDVLHTAVAWCIFADYDVEDTIAKVNKKFAARMNALKKIAKKEGHDNVKEMPLAYMLGLWEKAKIES